MYYLKKYLKGDAYKVVEGYFLLNTEEAYQEVKGLLEERFGNEFQIAKAFRERLHEWKKIPACDDITLSYVNASYSNTLISFTLLGILYTKMDRNYKS